MFTGEVRRGALEAFDRDVAVIVRFWVWMGIEASLKGGSFAFWVNLRKTAQSVV